ncbi:ABC transporter permease [Myxococcota bacterium]|nr:ABC transporter permease [Myxococcota bacterium]MBU1533869.1 ABC transporter permease [Myxococcota bacterium]
MGIGRRQGVLSPFHLALAFLGGVILLFILAPLGTMFLHTSAGEIKSTLGEAAVRESIVFTIITAMGSVLIFAIFALPLAWLIARRDFPGKVLVTAIIDLPIVIPHSAAGIALLTIFARDTLLGRTAEGLGFSFVSHRAGIMMAMAFVSLPHLMHSAILGFASVPERLEKAALNLGASPMRVFFTISLPLAWRHILTGFIMMWARGMSEFGAVIFIAYHPMVTPVMIFERFGAYGLKYARPVAVVFVTVSLVFFVIVRVLGGRRVTDVDHR